MRNLKGIVFVSFLFSIFFLCLAGRVIAREKDKAQKSLHTVYLDKPAQKWSEATPIGNGRLGGMVFGGVDKEKIQTNEDTFWSGEPRMLQKKDAHLALDGIRTALNKGDHTTAEKLIDTHMLGQYNQSYMPLADIMLDFGAQGKATNYRRELDLANAVVNVSYDLNGVHYQREIFASRPGEAIVIRLKADKQKISFSADLQSAVNFTTHTDGKGIVIRGRAPIHVEPNYRGVHAPIYKEGQGMRFEGRLVITETDGLVSKESGRLQLRDASHATLVFVAATSFNGYDKNPYTQGKDEKQICTGYLGKVAEKKYAQLRKEHLRDYHRLYNRVALDLGSSDAVKLPIDRRVKQYKEGNDPALTALYYQFGRYLLISSSRPGSQPANLQGIWSHLLQPAWSANWTINCNAQINYWAVESANLSECHQPLFDLIEDITHDGRQTARNLYNAAGWVAHHNVDIWRTTWPVGGRGIWAIYQVGGAWLCQHLWDHYLFTQDEAFLKKYYPILKEASLFYLDNLQVDESGYLLTSPSVSFENYYINASGQKGWACKGSSQDMQIIRALFKNTLQAATRFELDKDYMSRLAAALEYLPPIKISPSTGMLQEWNEDWEAASSQNGQVPHGWGFVQSDLMTLRGTPDLAIAFKKTLENRKPEEKNGSGSWTASFAANYWARLEEKDRVQQVLDLHFDRAVAPNLTSQFSGSWQIDGNLGITVAIGEMLLQSHAGEINLLPALPAKYPDGHVKGLMARGGYRVDIYWRNGILDKVCIEALKSRDDIVLRYGDIQKQFSFKNRKKVTVHRSMLN